MIKNRRESDVLNKSAGGTQPATLTPERIKNDLGDPQLAAGLTALLDDLSTGVWPVVGLSDAQALALESRRATLVRQRDLLADRMALVNAELKRLNQSATQPGGPTTATGPAADLLSTTNPAGEP